jgi:protein involved in ribonucleotide reduction
MSIFACTESEKTTSVPVEQKTDFTLDRTANAELSHEKLQLIPIRATENFIEAQASLSNLKNLAEGMEIERFRITEKKPFGSRDDREAVNNLTVQNKSTETIFLMEGDVVEGGRQDRILAEDMVVPPRTIRNISVFCVEHGRWKYEGETENSTPIALNGNLEQQNRKIQAFTGYYNVASNQVRRVVKKTDDQQAVWNEVDAVRSTFNITTPTKNYTGLESSEDFTKQRNDYLNFFNDKFERTDDVIGIVAVSGNKILGTDIFGHPELFKKQYKSLIHSYVTEALAADKTDKELEEKVLNLHENTLKHKYKTDNKSKFMWEGKTVHFSSL